MLVNMAIIAIAADLFSNTDFGKALASDSIKLPNANEIQNINLTLPYVFVSDDAFPLKSYMMRPYSANLKRESSTIVLAELDV